MTIWQHFFSGLLNIFWIGEMITKSLRQILISFILIPTAVAQANTVSATLGVVVQPGAATGALPSPPPGISTGSRLLNDEFSTTFPNQGTSSSPVTLDTSMRQIDHWCGSANYSGSYSSPNYGCAATNTASATVSGDPLDPDHPGQSSRNTDYYRYVESGW